MNSQDQVNLLREDFYYFFRTVAFDIVAENQKINKEVEKISNAPKAVPPEDEEESSSLWLTLGITLAVILLLAVLIGLPVYCCLKKRKSYSSEHVDEELDFHDDDDEHQRSPKGVAASPAPSPVAMSPKSPRRPVSPAVTPRRAGTPKKGKIENPHYGLSPIGLSPMKRNS